MEEMRVGNLDALPKGVQTALHAAAPWANAWGFTPTARVKRANDKVYCDGVAVLEWTSEDVWTALPWERGVLLRKERKERNQKSAKAYKARMEAAVEAAGTLRYVDGQEGGRLVLPSGESVSARGLFRRVTGRTWVWDSEEFHQFLVEVTNLPEVFRFQGRKARNNPVAEAQASHGEATDRKVQMLYQSW